MLNRYLPLLQEHHPDFVKGLPVLIDTLNSHSEDSDDWATKVGQTVIAITGRLDQYDTYGSVGAAFILYVRRQP